jgi:hypothetical protein
MDMNKRLLSVLAAAVLGMTALGAATPASAQVYLGADPRGVGVQVGPFGFGVGPDYWGYRHDPYAYAGDCRTIRERIVTPSGRVIFRTRDVCY